MSPSRQQGGDAGQPAMALDKDVDIPMRDGITFSTAPYLLLPMAGV